MSLVIECHIYNHGVIGIPQIFCAFPFVWNNWLSQHMNRFIKTTMKCELVAFLPHTAFFFHIFIENTNEVDIYDFNGQ